MIFADYEDEPILSIIQLCFSEKYNQLAKEWTKKYAM